MDVITLDDPSTRNLFETMFRQKNVIPVLGAGFSRHAKVGSGVVPDGEETRLLMLALLKEHAGPEAEELAAKDFASIATFFLNPEFVPTEIAKTFISQHFVGVQLDAEHRRFLDCPWPYIYTLNIDDGIEANSTFTHKIVPNRSISAVARTMRCVYKVHGDAAEELIYDEPSKIIFSTPQYVRSLMTNVSMLNALKTDLIEQNTLFVGCGLANEVDLLFALAEYQGVFAKGRKSIFVSTKNLSKFDHARLAEHGVNTILHIPTYDVFYSTVAAWGAALSGTVISTVAQFEASGNIRKLSLDRQVNLSFLVRDPRMTLEENRMSLPAYYIKRDIEDSIITLSSQTPLILLRGRRFSGRTLLLKSIAASAVSRNVYFIDSNSRISAELLDSLTATTNGLFLFDSNALTSETVGLLVRLSKSFMQRQCCAIVAASRTEPDVIGSVVAHVEDRADFELDPRLSEFEEKVLNRNLDRLGLLRFDRRKTLLENTYRILRDTLSSSSELTKTYAVNEREFELLLIIAVADKAFSSLATALDLRVEELYSFCDRLAPLLDLTEALKGERIETHSRFKIIANSTTGLGLMIRRVIDARGYEWLAGRFANLVRRLIDQPAFASVGQSMYMFDAVNYILSLGEGSGAGYRPVVRTLYQDLQLNLSGSPDYWLQRAKAVLAIEDEPARIIEGIEFATKSLREAERERTADNAQFLIALLYGKLCSIERYRISSHIIAAIEWFTQAIRNYDRNPNYINSMLDKGRHRKGWFEQLCDYLSGENLSIDILPLKKDVDYLLSAWRSLNSVR